MTIVFVGGVHGVGKSTCCAQVAEQLECVHVSASEVIRRQRADAIAASGKLVTDVGGNQELLLRGFESVKRLAGPASIMLDGHFALRDSERTIRRLSAELFSDLGVKHLVCIVDEVEAIVLRMGVRDGQSPHADDVSSLQKAELDNAKDVAKALRMPLTVLNGIDVEGLARAVRQIR